jgi:hypothetical protein
MKKNILSLLIFTFLCLLYFSNTATVIVLVYTIVLPICLLFQIDYSLKNEYIPNLLMPSWVFNGCLAYQNDAYSNHI